MSDRAPGLEPDRRTTTPTDETEAQAAERRAGQDRRRARRIRLAFDIAVPVEVSSEVGIQRGLARNLSEGGMLVELPEAPPIGSRVTVTFEGVRGSTDAPDAVELSGEVRHHLAWRYTHKGAARQLRGVGIRFVGEDTVNAEPLTSWVWRTGHTVH